MTLVDSHGFMANSSVLNGCLVLDGATSRGSDDGNVGDAASGIEQTKLVNDRGRTRYNDQETGPYQFRLILF